MSNRRYYTDAYTTQFTTRLVETIVEESRWGLVLDETYFYPESGGQPADFGAINGRTVTHVSIREEDGAIIHWLAEDVGDAGEVTAVIDWPRRFDHMQHHSGQHILSQAFIRAANAETISFHLSKNNVTIDLNRTGLTGAEIDAAEQLANQIVWENRPISVRFVTREEAAALSLRKIPAGRNGRLRLIDIDNFDLTACGGTHVNRTGSVGLVKILKQERRGEKTRIEFCCGGRALHDYGEKHSIVASLTTELTTGPEQLLNSITRLREENKAAKRTIKKQKASILAGTAQALLHSGKQTGGVTLIRRCYDEQAEIDLRALASRLTSQPGIVVLLGKAGSRTQLLLARSANAPGNMNQLLKAALKTLGGGGGGSPHFAQGGGPAHTPAEVEEVLAQIEKQIQ
jgi:alanyl-tRNA synthetase